MDNQKGLSIFFELIDKARSNVRKACSVCMPLFAALGVLIVVAIPAVYLFLLSISPFTFDEMDFDDSGYVTFSELIYANLNCYRIILNG